MPQYGLPKVTYPPRCIRPVLLVYKDYQDGGEAEQSVGNQFAF